MVHVATEYYPYARSGGLAEAVANLARYQSASAVRSLAILPLYRSARQTAGSLVEVGEPFRFRLGGREETGRLLRQRDAQPGAAIFFVEHDGPIGSAHLPTRPSEGVAPPPPGMSGHVNGPRARRPATTGGGDWLRSGGVTVVGAGGGIRDRWAWSWARPDG